MLQCNKLHTVSFTIESSVQCVFRSVQCLVCSVMFNQLQCSSVCSVELDVLGVTEARFASWEGVYKQQFLHCCVSQHYCFSLSLSYFTQIFRVADMFQHWIMIIIMMMMMIITTMLMIMTLRESIYHKTSHSVLC